jgi:hypothetical protein
MGDGFFGESGNGSTVDAATFLDSDITGAIGELVNMGCLVSIGVTRDRGALSLAVTNDGERARSYFRDVEEAVDWLRRGSALVRVRLGLEPRQEPAPIHKARRGRSTAL